MIEADLHSTYQIDLEEPGLLRARTGRWLRVRVLGLLADPKTRISRAIRTEQDPGQASTAEASFDDFDD